MVTRGASVLGAVRSDTCRPGARRACGTAGSQTCCPANQICGGANTCTGTCGAGGTCTTYTFTCGGPNNRTCKCAQSPEGTGVCTSQTQCSQTQPCTRSADCPSGYVCEINSCCGGGICAQVCNGGVRPIHRVTGPTDDGR